MDADGEQSLALLQLSVSLVLHQLTLEPALFTWKFSSPFTLLFRAGSSFQSPGNGSEFAQVHEQPSSPWAATWPGQLGWTCSSSSSLRVRFALFLSRPNPPGLGKVSALGARRSFQGTGHLKLVPPCGSRQASTPVVHHGEVLSPFCVSPVS